MIEERTCVEGSVVLAGTLCLPEDATAEQPAPAFLLLGGTGGDTRDGEMTPQRTSGIYSPPLRGTLRRIAHALAAAGIASFRYDKRGVGESGGDAATADYDTDLEDAKACFHWLRSRAEIDADRVGGIGHSAGVLVLSLLCRDCRHVAAAGLLAGLFAPAEEMIRWNWGRSRRYWDEFTEEQRDWLLRNRPREVLCGVGVEDFLRAASRGDETVHVAAFGQEITLHTRRARQDMLRPCADEFRHVRCPALVLHGGEDLNVHVYDSLGTYRELREAGNADVELAIVPGLEHNFIEASPDPSRRIWERVSLEAFSRPMSQQALDAITRWAMRVFRSQ
jgi:alpha-beta hydrolase superfamily lysophospholipase